MVICNSYISAFFEIGRTVSVALILLVANVPIVFAFFKSAVVQPYSVRIETVERGWVCVALEAARVLVIIVKRKISYLNRFSVFPRYAPLEKPSACSYTFKRNILRKFARGWTRTHRTVIPAGIEFLLFTVIIVHIPQIIKPVKRTATVVCGVGI